MLRDLLREARGSIGRVVTYADVEEVRAALLRNPPKVMVIGGAPIDPVLLDLLKKVITSHGVIGLAVADAHDLQLAMQAGAVEGSRAHRKVCASSRCACVRCWHRACAHRARARCVHRA